VQQAVNSQLSYEGRKEAAAWLAKHIQSAPAAVRLCLEDVVTSLTAASQGSQKQFNIHWRQLGRALGLIASSERRPSGNPLSAFKVSGASQSKNERERLEQQRQQVNALMQRYDDLRNKQQNKLTKLSTILAKMAANPETGSMQEIDIDTPLEDIELSEQAKAASAKHAQDFVGRLELGEGRDPALQPATEALMNASVVSTAQDKVSLDVDLPEGVGEEDVVKTLTETRVRYDFSVAVTRVELDVEKKVIVAKDGSRRVLSASTSEFGPPRYAVTWSALATLAIMIGQFAMPLNRLATMLTTSMKRYTAGSLSRMAHYVAERFVPIYLELADQVADSENLGGDDTSCRVVEISSYFSKLPKQGKAPPPPWAGYRTVADAEKSHAICLGLNQEIRKHRQEGERDAKSTLLVEPSLCLLIGRELDFESARRDGKGGKQSLNTTVVTGRSAAADPRSLIVFYRSHLGSLGNLLELLLRKRKPSARKLTVQVDLSTTNLVTDPALTSRFDIELFGCTSHARRPFALYEDQDRLYAPYMLTLFKGLAIHEHLLDRQGRNCENVLAVREQDSRPLWQEIKKYAETLTNRWSKDSPLGAAARYIVKHFEKLTAYLRNPRLEATNNLRERLLRTEKLIEKSSMFRRTIEGRVVLDILRTILQTAVAAGAPAHEYLVDVMRADPADIAKNPERYTPLAWVKRQPTKESKSEPAPEQTPSLDPAPKSRVTQSRVSA
jgi:hypothetical protein